MLIVWSAVKRLFTSRRPLFSGTPCRLGQGHVSSDTSPAVRNLHRQKINQLFDILELLIVRSTLLILLIVGSYTIIRGHL